MRVSPQFQVETISLTVVVYDRRYNLGFPGLNHLHPFDVRKFGRAWRELKRRLGSVIIERLLPVDRAASLDELLLAHDSEYLASTETSTTISQVLEVPALRRLPDRLLAWAVLRPMRWAVRGTILASKAALQHGVAINLGGGFHHAKRNRGEGFCFFSDIAVAVHSLKATGDLLPRRRIAYCDLDAHQGNGVCHQFMADGDVFIFDMYNASIYPASDVDSINRIDCKIPLPRGFSGDDYLMLLRSRLPGFLDSIMRNGDIPFGIYNAGTDVLVDDALGGLALGPRDILERDLFVLNEYRRRKIPVVILTSGGYTARSYRLIADSVEQILALGNR